MLCPNFRDIAWQDLGIGHGQNRQCQDDDAAFRTKWTHLQAA